MLGNFNKSIHISNFKYEGTLVSTVSDYYCVVLYKRNKLTKLTFSRVMTPVDLTLKKATYCICTYIVGSQTGCNYYFVMSLCDFYTVHGMQLQHSLDCHLYLCFYLD